MVIPLATTIWLSTIVSRFVLAFLTSIPKQFNPFITLNPLLQDLINLALGLTVPLMGILLIGLMARNIVGRWLLEFGEGTLSRIPLAGSVYKTLKQLLETFSATTPPASVVLFSLSTHGRDCSALVLSPGRWGLPFNPI